MEVHIHTRGKQCPDPEFDSLCCIFYSLHNDIPPDVGIKETSGVFMVNAVASSASSNDEASSGCQKSKSAQQLLHKCGLPNVCVHYVNTEEELIKEFAAAVVK